jgi:osmotically-inducible protein OsmY
MPTWSSGRILEAATTPSGDLSHPHKWKDLVMGKTKDIRAAVEDELDFDPLVDSTYVTVKNLNGDVALNGTVASYPQYQEAADAARRVQGVTNVHNHLEVMLPFGDYRDDPVLTTAANNALAMDVTVPSGVEATARDGNVRLAGTVMFASQRLAAAGSVSGLIGVRNIHDDIDVQSTADPIEVTNRVQGALDRHSLIADDSDIVIDTTVHTVTLIGHVRSWAEHDAAIGAAWMSDGVWEVRDDLLVTG